MTIDYIPENLELWKTPDSWFGTPWNGYYVFLGRHRDSDDLSESNYHCALRELGGESETVVTVCESHWAVGWIEWIAIHKSDSKSLAIADDLAGALSDYPVLDETDFSKREWESVCTNWESDSIGDRVENLRRCRMSIFQARRDYFPSDDSGNLFEIYRSY